MYEYSKEIEQIHKLITKFNEDYETEYKHDWDLWYHDAIRLIYKIAKIVGIKINKVFDH